jgi:asparagine synthase (glutamine-hydrolysing)
MCGITGAYSLSQTQSPYFSRVKDALQALHLRGPDSQDIYESDFAHLGHARLAILDLSETANQPMVDASGHFTIVYNGEIYNFQELREGLIQKGVQFKTNSDTEVLLELYAHEGEKCLEKLNGFFAFAIIDKRDKSIFLARDRFGIKPLYYYLDKENLVFSSEMKSLESYGIETETDNISLYLFLQLTYIPAPYSIYKNVFKLMPGQSLKIKNGQVEKSQFYQLKLNPEKYADLSYTQQQEALRSLLEDSVKKRLISDVPLGAFLSGGIDSSVIVALASKHTQNLKTFSVGHRDHQFHDETHYAQMVADKYQTDHTVVKLSAEEYLKHIPKILDYLGEPFADSSAIGVYSLSQEIRKHVTVALSGDGADEVFAGYNKYYGEYLIRHPNLKVKLAKSFSPLLSALPKSRDGKISNLIRQIDRFNLGSKQPVSQRYLSWCSFNQKDFVNDILHQELKQELQERADEVQARMDELITPLASSPEDFNALLLNDVHLVLPNDMLTKVDRMSMANSLEVRVPFLDHSILEFAFSIGSEAKINGQMKKRILQDTFRDLLPAEIYNRPKQGFTIPLMDWLKKNIDNQDSQYFIDESLLESMSFIKSTKLKNIKREVATNSVTDYQPLLWALLNLQTWHKRR